MRIGLLGPLSVANRTSELRITAPNQRTLLAALAIRAGEAVSTESLATALWDEALPRSWAGTLRNEIKRLRDSLGRDSGRHIATRAPGYCLEVDKGEVDVFAFEGLCNTGRAAARARDWQEVSARLSEAEALWRGAPFADIRSEHLKGEHVPYLTERRLQAHEQRIEADLHLVPCRAPDVVPELQKLTRLNPDRDHPRVLLMLALYRCGRQTAALAAYQEAWKYYREDHGVEPGAELRDMQERILRGDGSLLLEPVPVE
jgi:DNA-binding SARP family transcriptional activator